MSLHIFYDLLSGFRKLGEVTHPKLVGEDSWPFRFFPVWAMHGHRALDEGAYVTGAARASLNLYSIIFIISPRPELDTEALQRIEGGYSL